MPEEDKSLPAQIARWSAWQSELHRFAAAKAFDDAIHQDIVDALGIPQDTVPPGVAQYRGMGMDVGIGPIPPDQLRISQAIVNESDQVIRVTAAQSGVINNDLTLYQQEAIQQMVNTHPWYIRNGVPEDVILGLDPGQMDVQVAGRTHRIQSSAGIGKAEVQYINQMEGIVASLKTKCNKLYRELEEAYGTINQQDQMLVDLRAKVKELVQPAPLVRAKLDLPLKPYKD